jgi:esterase/lipase superfamily enzyme
VSAGTRRFPTVAGLLLACVLSACASRPTAVLAPVADTVPSTSRVEMLVVTTRKESDQPGEMFTGERGPSPAFADILVSIPQARKVGEVQWPKKLPPNPETDFATLKTDRIDRQEAIALLSRAMKARPDRSVLVFIHGFNNRFEDSVYRFAQIVHDSGTKSAPILVTWPSRGRLTAYGYDRESTNYTRNALEDLFQFLSRAPEIREVSILAHSMGNWLALEGLRQMAIRNGGLPPKFKNIMLAAPDVDVDVFRSQIADMGNPRPNFTLFVSRDDRALAVSRRVWGDVARLGSIDPEQDPYRAELADNNITVIDLTKVKGGDKLHHDKFASSPEIVQSIGARLSDNQTLTDSHVGLGDTIIAATSGAASSVGTAVGLAVAAPVAIVDQDTRDNLGTHLGSATGAASRSNASKAATCETDPPDLPCDR